jgi:hypothetical protein
MDSKELREMSIQNAKMAMDQKLRIEEGFWRGIKDEFDSKYPLSESDELWGEVTKLAETKNNSVKRLNIVGIDKCEWSSDGIVVEYIGRNLSYEEDNYMWEITDIIDIDSHKEFILLRNSIEKGGKRVWLYSVWEVDDSYVGNKKVLLKSGVVEKTSFKDPKSLIYTILQNTLTDYKGSIK